MTAAVWERITQLVHGKVAKYFEPKENQVILDFIRTAKADISIVIIKELGEES